MRFALLGNHPDGLQMAKALVDSGRHELAAYCGPSIPWETTGIKANRTSGDMEEILADPAIDAVVVAGNSSQRSLQLRRALQSERHVLCVYPPDENPDSAYEAAMIQADTRRVLLPILLGALHPAVRRLQTLLQTTKPSAGWLIQWDRECCPAAGSEEKSKAKTLTAYFHGWEVLQLLGGPIAEVSAFAERPERLIDEPLLVAGRFEKGGLFQATLQPSSKSRWRLQLTATALQADLNFPNGFPGPATLTWQDETEACHTEEWPAHNLFSEVVKIFEDAVQKYEQAAGSSLIPKPELGNEGLGAPSPQELITWQDAIRCAELDDAARRSVERRRASTLEYPEATEEASFKGTMTLIGCGMLWLMLVLLVLSRWYPALLAVIVLMLTLFLSLQLLRLIVRK